MKDRLIGYGRSFARQFGEDDVAGIGAELAYRFLFAVFPFGIFLAALASFVAQWTGTGDPTSEIMGALDDNLPAAVADQIRPQLEAVIGSAQPGLLSFGALGAIWAATGGTSSLMKAMNRAYDVEEGRGFVQRTAVAVVLTLLASVGILVSFVTIVGGSAITEDVAGRLGIGGAAWTAITLLRWPLVLALLALAVGLLFRFAPVVRVAWRWCLLGGAMFAIVWLVATALFALYVSNFANYANTYGALGGVIVLMLWFYITGIVMVSSAELVAIIAAEQDPDAAAAGARRRAPRGSSGGSSTSGPDDPAGATQDRPAGASASPIPGAFRTGPHAPSASAPSALPPSAAAPVASPRATSAATIAQTLSALAILVAGAIAGVLLGRVTGVRVDDGS